MVDREPKRGGQSVGESSRRRETKVMEKMAWKRLLRRYVERTKSMTMKIRRRVSGNVM